jgi:uncharacterized protein YndB with AHSA1/START domain
MMPDRSEHQHRRGGGESGHRRHRGTELGKLGKRWAAFRNRVEINDMSEASSKRASTQVSKMIKATRKALYQACLDPDALASWRRPEDMTVHVHAFDAHEGGRFRISLTYRDPEHSPGGKTSEDMDTFQGRFIELVPDEKIVEVVVFETRDPRFSGEMKITTSFADTGEGTEVTILCQDIPAGIRPEDNEMGCRSSLQNLAALTE